ncbi:MAG: hypothetical protein U5J99_01555 [Parvularculaceae bacterium]|nr:hypothetical protein [Parvularculaceae bacterium]
MTDARLLAADPEWLPDAFDAGRGVIRFARMSAEVLRREAFLDARKDLSVTARAEARIADLAPHIKPAPPASYVFHSAFCGSTLLARALDVPGKSLALKEPGILLDLVNARRAHPAFRSDSVYRQYTDVILGLLHRRRAPGEAVLIKPTNLALPLAGALIARGAPVLFLHGALREFLMSILKKGEEGRAFARKMFNIFAMDGTPLGAIEPRQAMSLTDLQTAALVWRHQIEEIIALLVSAPQTASLDYASFIADPEIALRAAAKALTLDIDAAALAAIASGPVFKTDAKFTASPFTAQTRKTANDDLEKRHGPELSLIASWAEKLRLSRDLKSPLPNALAQAV